MEARRYSAGEGGRMGTGSTLTFVPGGAQAAQSNGQTDKQPEAHPHVGNLTANIKVHGIDVELPLFKHFTPEQRDTVYDSLSWGQLITLKFSDKVEVIPRTPQNEPVYFVDRRGVSGLTMRVGYGDALRELS